MKKSNSINIVDANEAVANIAYKTNEICVIYPITPASSMGEFADQWSSQGIPNIWNTTPHVVAMQSEGGAAGALHGAVQTGGLATTFTSSQGLLLMIPNMYRIAAELTPTVFHVASRIIAYQGMSIYCDHSDVMATRSTGFAMLCSNNVQEAQDFALIAQASTLKSRIPFLHFFDGFRTSHEVNKISAITDDEIRAMIDDDLIREHRERKLTPEKPVIRAAIQNQDIVFQARESANLFYENVEVILDEYLRRFEKLTGRSYNLLDYAGAKDAKHIIVIMGSGADTVHETVSYMQQSGEKVAVIKIHLFRPFPKQSFIELLPESCESIAVLDRTKESGASGEPLYLEVLATVFEAFNSKTLKTKKLPNIIGGRFGIGSKEFTPGMVMAIFEELKKASPKNHFSIGIVDDVTHTSLNYDASLDIEDNNVFRAIFYGLAADGTVGANKNSAKIIGEETGKFVQAYFAYDAGKFGSKTTSHLRFGENSIHSAYLIQSANFIGCHQYIFVHNFNVLENASGNATFLLNSIYSHEEVWDRLPRILQHTIIEKKIKFYVIDAYKVATDAGLGGHINTIMQTCFFALSDVLSKEIAIEKIKDSIKSTYSKKGDEKIKKNFDAVDFTLQNLFRVNIPSSITSQLELKSKVSSVAPDFVKTVIEKMLSDKGHELPVSSIPTDGSYPLGTTKWEKRNLSFNVPVWNHDNCFQCGQCSIVCPHSAIRVKYFEEEHAKDSPEKFKSAKSRHKQLSSHNFALHVYGEDCTGCGLCVEACPTKLALDNKRALKLDAKSELKCHTNDCMEFFETLPQVTPTRDSDAHINVRDLQHLPPFFEFCNACAGCGEASYVRLLTQLYGDRLLIADACGCSLVYGCNLPTMPWTTNKDGRGPAFSGSLFEDNAEFGFGYALTADKHFEYAVELLDELRGVLGDNLIDAIKKDTSLRDTKSINAKRELIKILKDKLSNSKDPKSKQLLSLSDYLIRPSIWAVGGDGWAYDIGYGGLDHVISSGRKINILVLDTEVYSNTGGQASKSTSRGSVVKFASEGKQTAKKDLGFMAMTYENVYVASISLGANPNQALKAFQEAEQYPGPSLIIAYCHCIAHGVDMRFGMDQQKLAVKSGYWLLYRYNPLLALQGLNPLQLDSNEPSVPLEEYMYSENRFRILLNSNPKQAEKMLNLAKNDVAKRWKKYKALSSQ